MGGNFERAQEEKIVTDWRQIAWVGHLHGIFWVEVEMSKLGGQPICQ